MAAPVTFISELPPPGRSFCCICASAAKAAWLAEHQDELAATQHNGGGTLHMLLPGVELAVTIALQVLPLPPPAQGAGPVLVPVCWSHLQPVQFIESSLMPASMIPTGPGGAVDLSQRRGH
jgi:hypothetical protein